MNVQLLTTTQKQVRTFLDLFGKDVIICYNGGKDSTVLLHLVYESYVARFPGETLKLLHVEDPSEFIELRQFVRSTESRYKCIYLSYKFIKIEYLFGPLKRVIKEFHELNPLIKGYFIASRSSDLKCNFYCKLIVSR
jgi:FAD synthetase